MNDSMTPELARRLLEGARMPCPFGTHSGASCDRVPCDGTMPGPTDPELRDRAEDLARAYLEAVAERDALRAALDSISERSYVGELAVLCGLPWVPR